MKAINAKTHEVQAILQGRKTQMRLIVEPQPEQVLGHFFWKGTDGWNAELIASKCKYQPGDILYVRETWALPTDENGADGGYQFKADYKDGSEDWKWKPSIHMPKEAARIFLRVKSVWVERLCDISEADAIAEGVETLGLYPGYEVSSRGKFEGLWNLINGDCSWDANPWVWVIEFEQIPDPR